MSLAVFHRFFSQVTGEPPFPYQRAFAEGAALPDLLSAPTGAGKTATVVLGWLWRRRFHPDAAVRAATPRRLVFCLPMRTLVEQTERAVRGWLETLAITDLGLHSLMGGAVDESWEAAPERDAILIGTQDQLLSRALNRGYAMSRYRWPVHFALLNNDCLWVLDEIQLMGVGASTSAQLAALRSALGTAAPCASIWMSATIARGRLDTVDLRTRTLSTLSLTDEDLATAALARRHQAAKPLARAGASSCEARPAALAKEVLDVHVAGSLTLVVCNRVARAQAVFAAVQRAAPAGVEVALVHSRFRPAERRRIQAEVLAPGWSGILVATQAIEAGVDISARVLFTEVASWSSLVQRFGRCNRRGEFVDREAAVRWIDVPDDEAAPYLPGELAISRAHLAGLRDVGPASLGAIPLADESPVLPVLRRRDLVELFDTQPDLAGHDLDVSRFVRSDEGRDVQVAWRELPEDGPSDDAPEPHRDELCSVPIEALRKLLAKQRAYRWSGLKNAWEPCGQRQLVPGTAMVIAREVGGYHADLGWTGAADHVPDPVPAPRVAADSDEREPLSFACSDYVTLTTHANDVAEAAAALRATLGGTAPWDAIERAARWHDLGKVHPVFQEVLVSGLPNDDARRGSGPWAKSDGRPARRFARPAFRHELASALAFLQHGASDLEAYLVAAHHGKVRLSIRSRPTEREPGDERRFALGIWDGDRLPAVDLGGGVISPAVVLVLDVMELGDGPMGPSWLARTTALLDQHGPFRIAFWESLVRVADWRGTARRRAAGGLEAQ
ncbi:MAG TPA: CRISPR-associated helicase Cas3' [Kofleriaceae bacterium]|jgi:CRISPR-associated endonuclease/helicase Cas3|nr:CRISPR-associated helicase Cas3' [Kofleriaceae bacterium]